VRSSTSKLVTAIRCPSMPELHIKYVVGGASRQPAPLPVGSIEGSGVCRGDRASGWETGNPASQGHRKETEACPPRRSEQDVVRPAQQNKASPADSRRIDWSRRKSWRDSPTRRGQVRAPIGDTADRVLAGPRHIFWLGVAGLLLGAARSGHVGRFCFPECPPMTDRIPLVETTASAIAVSCSQMCSASTSGRLRS
jgi:hypothetical protein